MCNRYTLTRSIEEVSERFNIEKEEYYRPRYNAAPTQLLPVISIANPNRISFYHWGTIPQWSKSKTISKKLYNLNAEDIEKKPSSKRALIQSRCIVPADGIYFWKSVSKKSEVPYRFAPTNKDMFSFAALWEEFENEKDEIVHTFTIITSSAKGIIKNFEDTMPIVFDRDKENIWLSPKSTIDELMDVLSNNSMPELDHYAVSPVLNDISKDEPSIIIPAAPADQFGNYSLFE